MPSVVTVATSNQAYFYYLEWGKSFPYKFSNPEKIYILVAKRQMAELAPGS